MRDLIENIKAKIESSWLKQLMLFYVSLSFNLKTAHTKAPKVEQFVDAWVNFKWKTTVSHVSRRGKQRLKRIVGAGMDLGTPTLNNLHFSLKI